MLGGVYNYYYTTGNGVCPEVTSFAEVTIENPGCYASITNEELVGFELFPNPTVNTVHLSYKGDLLNAQLSLVDNSGKLIISEEVVFETGTVKVISLEDYPAGVYFLTIVAESGRNVIRLVKQ
jgi:hypothetical protein